MELKIKISDEETLTTELPEVLTLDEFRVWLKKFEKYSEVFVNDIKLEYPPSKVDEVISSADYSKPTKKYKKKRKYTKINKTESGRPKKSGIVPNEEAYKETIREFRPGQKSVVKEISKEEFEGKEPKKESEHKAVIVPIDATEVIKRLRNDRDLVIKLYTIYYKGSPEDFNSFCQSEQLDSAIKSKEKFNIGFGWARVYHGISPEEVGVEEFT
jgi:hypothetical protein